ncbi:hypothetical protein J3F82_003952, partial [Coemansia sp. RSA 637]
LARSSAAELWLRFHLSQHACSAALRTADCLKTARLAPARPPLCLCWAVWLSRPLLTATCSWVCPRAAHCPHGSLTLRQLLPAKN